MTNTIQLDVREYLEIHYPKLSLEEIDLIASDIHRRWDYTLLESQVKEKLQGIYDACTCKLQGEN